MRDPGCARGCPAPTGVCFSAGRRELSGATEATEAAASLRASWLCGWVVVERRPCPVSRRRARPLLARFDVGGSGRRPRGHQPADQTRNRPHHRLLPQPRQPTPDHPAQPPAPRDDKQSAVDLDDPTRTGSVVRDRWRARGVGRGSRRVQDRLSSMENEVGGTLMRRWRRVAAPCLLSRKMFSILVRCRYRVLDLSGFVLCGHVEVGEDERTAVDRGVSAGHLSGW